MAGGEAAPAAKILIPVYADVDMLDVCGPHELFSWAGFQVDLVAEEPGTVQFNHGGFSFLVPDGLGPAQPYDALWVPGGNPNSLARIMRDPKRTYLDFLVRQAPQSRFVCSVCEGALLLADAGLLDGYAATTHWAFVQYLLDTYPKVTVADGHPRFVLDHDRLTGGGISSGLDEALRLIELLAGTPAAQDVQQTTQYYPAPPVTSEIPNTSFPFPPPVKAA